MRGKVAIIEKSDKVFRITPAYAGKSFETRSDRSATWDHPRLCGEKTTNDHKVGQRGGSPPPMRGKE